MKKFYLVLFFFISICIFLLYSYGFIITHIIPINNNFVINVNSGDTLTTIIKELREKGLKGNPLIIKLYTRLFFKNLIIKIGSYEVTQYTTYWTILQDINKGIGIPLKITIPPGLNIDEIAYIFENSKILTKSEFLSYVKDMNFLEDAFANNYNYLANPTINDYWAKFKFNINEKKLEGFFYPETYSFAKGVAVTTILKEPIQHFFKILDKFPIANLSFLEIYKKIIIASLIEEEAMLDEEKPIIASVIYNRLSKNMRLELCPTVEYILPSHKKKLTLDDLNIKSPYNTYINSGLPPTPICNPSFESLKAAFFPAKTEYLFYVAKGDGSHYFSKTFQEHLRYKNNSKYY